MHTEPRRASWAVAFDRVASDEAAPLRPSLVVEPPVEPTNGWPALQAVGAVREAACPSRPPGTAVPRATVGAGVTGPTPSRRRVRRRGDCREVAAGHPVAGGGRDVRVAGVERRYSQPPPQCGRLPRRGADRSTGATRLRPWPALPGRWWRPTLSTAFGPALSTQHGRGLHGLGVP